MTPAESYISHQTDNGVDDTSLATFTVELIRYDPAGRDIVSLRTVGVLPPFR